MTDDASHCSHPVEAEEDVGALRRAVSALAAKLPGLPRGDAELVATELATNILRHTAGGYVLYREAAGGVELLAVDHGSNRPAPGLPPLTVASWTSTAPAPRTGTHASGTGLGVGLAGVRRRAAVFDYYSCASGTVVLASLQPASPAPSAAWRWGAVNVPLGGCGVSGDAWRVIADGFLAALVVDGLGHGPEAHLAARAAVGVFNRRYPRDSAGAASPDTVEALHRGMLGTRGGVLGMCLIDPESNQVTYTGVGNIAGQVISGGTTRRLLGHPGTVGDRLKLPGIRPVVHPWPTGGTLILTSDGIRTQWSTEDYPRLLDRHPAVVAATLHRDHARGRDDATVLVVQDLRVHPREEDTQ